MSARTTQYDGTHRTGAAPVRGGAVRRAAMLLLAMLLAAAATAPAQTLKRGNRQIVSGGVLQKAGASERTDSLAEGRKADSLAVAARLDSAARAMGIDPAQIEKRAEAADSVAEANGAALPEQIKENTGRVAELADTVTVGENTDGTAGMRRRKPRLDKEGDVKIRQPLFSDSSSLAKVCWTSAILPGYGQIYNKQYWKLPVLYTTLGASVGMAIHEGNLYRPLKRRYEALTAESMSRTEELNALQSRMIRTNTKRQIFWVTAAASYIYFLGDAAVNYSTNEVSDVKKATTLSLICPGAGQIYNKSYWKVPIVIGGMASMVYVIDWNNRGFQRFKKAYALRADFENNPGNYPDGVSHDEFRGRYSATYLKNLRDAYRRNRDLSLILTVAVYAFQAIDAHVDAHLKDFDVSDELTVDLQPMFDCQYSQINGTQPVFGFNLNIKF